MTRTTRILTAASVLVGLPVAAQQERRPAAQQERNVGAAQAACTPTTTALQFDGGYEVSMCYVTPDGGVGQAKSGIWASGKAGLLWFFERDNAEVLVKVLDGCSHNGHRWVFVAPVTTLEFNLWVTAPSGRRWTYGNTQGTTASAKSDAAAFRCADETVASQISRTGRDAQGTHPIAGGSAADDNGGRGSRAGLHGTRPRGTARAGRAWFRGADGSGVPTTPLWGTSTSVEGNTPFVLSATQADCTPTTSALQFDGGYEVSMCYVTPDGEVGQAKSGIWTSGKAGLLWFFERDNAEVLVKVLDGCSHNGHRWVFVAPVTTLEFNLWVTAPSGRRWTHGNTQGTTASTKSDLSAFDCAEDDGGEPVGFYLASDNNFPAGIVYAQGRFYVLDSRDEKVYAYRASNGQRVPTADFDLAYDHVPNVFRHYGLTYAEGRFYVADERSERVYAYRASDGRRDPTADFDLAYDNASNPFEASNSDPSGLTYAQGRFYVVDSVDEKVYAYRASDGRHDAAADFDLASGNTSPVGITYAEGHGLYVVDTQDERVYRYRISDGRHDLYFDLAYDHVSPFGITYAGDTDAGESLFFVLDDFDNRVVGYRVGTGGGDTSAFSSRITLCSSRYSSVTGNWWVTIGGSVRANRSSLGVTVTGYVQPGKRRVGSQSLGRIRANQTKSFYISRTVSGAEPSRCQVEVSG